MNMITYTTYFLEEQYYMSIKPQYIGITQILSNINKIVND